MFKNLKIIELASVLAGPAVGMFFAELGANVIKVENKKNGGDVTRGWKGDNEKNRDNLSAYYCSVNWNKKNLFLDITSTSDYAQLLDLIKTADVVIANFKHNKDTELKVDFNTLKQLNPKLIYAKIIGFSSAPNRLAYDAVLQAESGFMSINGQADTSPTKMPIAMIDILAAHQLKEGVLCALLNKTKTGKGALVEVSLEKTAIASLANQATNWLMNNEIPQQIGTKHPNIAPYGEICTSKDKKQFVLAIGSDSQFKKLLQIIGLDKLFSDNRFKNNALRVTNREELEKLLNKRFKTFDAIYLKQQFLEKGVPMGQVKNIKEVFDSPIAQQMILEEIIEGHATQRVRSIAFEINDSYHL